MPRKVQAAREEPGRETVATQTPLQRISSGALVSVTWNILIVQYPLVHQKLSNTHRRKTDENPSVQGSERLT